MEGRWDGRSDWRKVRIGGQGGWCRGADMLSAVHAGMVTWSVRTQDGDTALMMARRRGHAEVEKLLLVHAKITTRS